MGKIKGSIAVFIAGASFGILSTFVKKAYEQGFTLGEVTGSQALFGAFFLWAIYLIFKPKNKENSLKQTPAWKLLLCGISTGAVSILYYKCVELVPASVAIVLLMQYIWIGMIIEFVFFKTKPTIVQIIGSPLVIAGTLLSTGIFEENITSVSKEGVIYGMLAATSYSLFILLNGRVGNDYSVVKKSALMITGALILITIVLFPYSLLTAEVLLPILPYALLLSIFGTVIPPLLFAYGMPKTGYSLGSILSAVELPVAVLMSYFILHEYVSFLQWTGVVFILLIIIGINLIRKKS